LRFPLCALSTFPVHVKFGEENKEDWITIEPQHSTGVNIVCHAEAQNKTAV
jgi:predicted SAM-dependent methyltransferase